MLAIALQGLELHEGRASIRQLGLDKHFYDRRKAGGKTVQGLETAEFQISRFDDMTMEQQDRMLAETLKELDDRNRERRQAGRRVEDRRRRARRAASRSPDLKSDPLMYQRLLVERNKNWMPKIEALFARRGHALVVVGAAHLVGPDGLLAMLRAKGYTVEQL